VKNKLQRHGLVEEATAAHLVHLTIHAIPSCVILLPAQITSPSFSLDSSSMTTTNSPRRIASTASDTGSNRNGEGGMVAAFGFNVGADILQDSFLQVEAVSANVFMYASGLPVVHLVYVDRI